MNYVTADPFRRVVTKWSLFFSAALSVSGNKHPLMEHVPNKIYDSQFDSDLCARNSDSNGVMKIVRMLNVLYTTFDVLTDPRKNPNIYKVPQVKSLSLNRAGK